MAYRRRYRKKRYYPRKGGFAKKALGYASTAVKALALAKQVAAVVNVEEKYASPTVNAGSLPIITSVTTPFLLLNGITEGNTQAQRNGISIKTNHFKVRGFCQWNASGLPHQTVRCIIVRKNANNGVSTVPTDFLDITNCPTISTNPDYTQALLNPVSYKALGYHIIMDRTYVLSANRPYVPIICHHQGKYHVRYNGTGSTSAAIDSNVVEMWMFTDCSANQPTGAMGCHYYFVDN